MIRNATIEDAFRIAEIQVSSWKVAYRDIIPESYLQGLRAEQRERTWRRFVDDDHSPLLVTHCDGEITGFCHISPSRDSDTHNAAEIIAIYIDPLHWRKGMGRALCSSALSFAYDHGFSLVTLWTLSKNHSAQHFYEALGFQADGASKSEAMAGFVLDEVRYRFRISQSDAAGNRR